MKTKLPIAVVLLACGMSLAQDQQQYKVDNTNNASAWYMGKYCVLTVRDEANPNVSIVLMQRKHIGQCTPIDAGTVLTGSRKKNKILLPSVNKDEWEIKMTQDTSAYMPKK
jgi:hypothetical protein